MPNEVRTLRGRLIGTFDEQTGALSIKDGKKLTQIRIPPSGLYLSHTFSDGVCYYYSLLFTL